MTLAGWFRQNDRPNMVSVHYRNADGKMAGHATWVCSVGGTRYLLNGNDCASWAGDTAAVDGKPLDGFHTREFADCVRPLMERERGVQWDETVDPVGDCEAFTAACEWIYDASPGSKLDRLRRVIAVAMSASGIRDFCAKADAIVNGGAGAGAAAAFPVVSGREKRKRGM